MSCPPDWPPPLPSLPPYPPCVGRQKLKEIQRANLVQTRPSSTQEWWDNYLGQALKGALGMKTAKKSALYELTRKQRRKLLQVKIPTKQEKLIRSIPLPEGSFPPNGLPIWERLYLDHPLPMLKAPPNALVFARQKIGKKLWKDTEHQEFILYDPQGYEVQFSYENVHDPHLTNYYQGKEIRAFLLSMGDANSSGWGICTLKRFNQYRRYLRRVHISQVHKKMEIQDAFEDEMHRMKLYRQVTKNVLEEKERNAIMEEEAAAKREALKQYRINRVARILKNIRDKEKRVKKLYKRRLKEQELRVKKGQKLLAEQELKKKISNEINRRKKIITLRRWHDNDEKRKKILRKAAEEKTRQKLEKVRLRWQNKIDNQRKMFAVEDEHLHLQAEIRKLNIDLRNWHVEEIKKNQFEKFQELRKRSLTKKATAKKKREDKRMSDAIMKTWLDSLQTEYEMETEEYRVKKSINSTIAELMSQDTEGPDRYSIIILARNRIQKEQAIPLQVSYAIEIILERTIEMWATQKLILLLETVSKELIQHGYKQLEMMKMKNKDIGKIKSFGNYKSKEPKGIIFSPDKEEKNYKTSDSSRTTLAETEIKETTSTEQEKATSSLTLRRDVGKGVIVSYVHFGLTESFKYQGEDDVEVELKPVSTRPKTPMPCQKVLCEAGFSETKLKDVLPTMSDVSELKEKKKFRKVFRSAAIQLFKRAILITERCYEPKTRFRALNKLIYLGDTQRLTLAQMLNSLIMNKTGKAMYEEKEFEHVARAIGREAVNEVLKPSEFLRVQDDGIARTKIMFCKPRKNPQ